MEKGVATAFDYAGDVAAGVGTYIRDNKAKIGGYVVGAVVIAGAVYLVVQTGGTAAAPAYALVLATI